MGESMNIDIKGTAKFGLSGSTLKIIAIISMVMDHFAAAVVYYMLLKEYSPFCTIDKLWKIYEGMRSVGRIAFPIYCFLIVEGFFYTSNRKKYALRLGGFALISEIPFDLAFYDSILWWKHQNVFFVLVLGLITIMLLDKIKVQNMEAVSEKAVMLANLKGMLVILMNCFLATLLHMDYYFFGILAIVIMYMTREYRLKQCLTGAIAFAWEMPAPLAYILLYFYNGKRGINLKYFFYIFYPAHLLIFYLIRVLVI